jgi:hypothetical protein
MMIVQVIAQQMFEMDLTFQHNLALSTAIIHDNCLQKYN